MNNELHGVKGWLAFFVCILALLSPVLSVLMTWYAISAEPPSNDPKLGALNNLDWGTLALQVAIDWFIVYRLVAVRNWLSVRIAVAGLWLGTLVPTLIYCFGYAAIYTMPVGEVFASIPFYHYLDGLLFNLVWTLYLLKSLRVANTYRSADEQAEVFE
jgi:hypothetical protein